MSDLTNIPPAGGGDDKPVVQSYSHQPIGARVPEKVARGGYSTGQLVLDSPKAFIIDFIHGLYPNGAVSSRVFVAAPQLLRRVAQVVVAMQSYQTAYVKRRGARPIRWGESVSVVARQRDQRDTETHNLGEQVLFAVSL